MKKKETYRVRPATSCQQGKPPKILWGGNFGGIPWEDFGKRDPLPRFAVDLTRQYHRLMSN